jgi:hypothetical protein
MRVMKLLVFGSMVLMLAGVCGSLLLVEQKIGLANVLPIKLMSNAGLL